jgi:hypothetical protein
VMRRGGEGTYGGGLSMLLVVVLERFDGAVSRRSTTDSVLTNIQRDRTTYATTSSETLLWSPALPLLDISDSLRSEG